MALGRSRNRLLRMAVVTAATAAGAAAVYYAWKSLMAEISGDEEDEKAQALQDYLEKQMKSAQERMLPSKKGEQVSVSNSSGISPGLQLENGFQAAQEFVQHQSDCLETRNPSDSVGSKFAEDMVPEDEKIAGMDSEEEQEKEEEEEDKEDSKEDLPNAIASSPSFSDLAVCGNGSSEEISASEEVSQTLSDEISQEEFSLGFGKQGNVENSLQEETKGEVHLQEAIDESNENDVQHGTGDTNLEKQNLSCNGSAESPKVGGKEECLHAAENGHSKDDGHFSVAETETVENGEIFRFSNTDVVKSPSICKPEPEITQSEATAFAELNPQISIA